jgi:hypothetical protein
MTIRPPVRPQGPEQAIEHGLAALNAGDLTMAAQWFDRCWRLAPDDPASILLCAASLSRAAPRRAEKLLAHAVTARPDVGALQVALAAVRSRLGHHDDAAALLQHYLAAFAPPDDAAFPRLAAAIAWHAGRPGWVGVDCAGRVACDVTGGAAITMMLDGVTLPAQSGPAQSGPAQSGQLSTSVLGTAWLDAETLDVATADGPLLGSPVTLRTRNVATGIAAFDDTGDVHGWAYLAADPAAPPRLRLLGGGHSQAVTLRPWETGAASPLGAPRGAFWFHVPQAGLPPSPVLRVVGPGGHDLLGSPLHATGEPATTGPKAGRLQAARGRGPGRPTVSRTASQDDVRRQLPVSCLPPLLGHLAPSPCQQIRRRPVDVIIPVHRGAAELAACLAGLLPTLPRRARITIVDDGSREPELRALLAGRLHPRITILRHAQQRGRPAAANTGLRHAAAAPDGPRDAVLLSAGALVQPGWLQQLAHSAYRRADIGSVTPATNDGGLTAITPPYPDAVSHAALAAACARAPSDGLIDIPAATGCCHYLRHDCLAATGVFREDVFAQGDGEDLDWSFRARQLGWRHAADMAVFVARRGGGACGPADAALRGRNSDILDRLHPGASAAMAEFRHADTMTEIRRRIECARWRDGASDTGAVILITHDHGGGVARHIATRIAELRSLGQRPILVRPVDDWAATPPDQRRCAIKDDRGGFHHLIFQPHSELDALAELLAPDRPQSVELHHIMGHAPAITGLAARLSVPLDIIVHDYALLCPRVTLTGAGQTYCGEPADIADCTACVSNYGDRLMAGMAPVEWRAWTVRRVAEARHIVVPDADVAKRLARHVDTGGKLVIQPWETDSALPRIAAPGKRPIGQPLRICIPGAIGDEKGYGILLACARDAARRHLPLHFTIAGHTRDDATLMDTDHIFVTGRYADDEAVSVITAQRADLGFIPSVWPETWCYSLTLLWRAGLWPVAFAFGVPAARIAARRAGTILPLGLPAARINDLLLAINAQQSTDENPHRRLPAGSPMASTLPPPAAHRTPPHDLLQCSVREAGHRFVHS